jgi:hypothetical protein
MRTNTTDSSGNSFIVEGRSARAKSVNDNETIAKMTEKVIRRSAF